MAGTITMAGLASNMDVEGLIEGLSNVARSSLSTVKSRAAAQKSAVSTVSDIGSLLAKLKLAVADLDTEQEVGSYKASSSSTGIVASASGSALPGAYAVTVTKLAHEQRTYSNAQVSASDALGLSGSFNLGVGAGTPVGIAVTAGDSLNGLADKINGAGLRVTASVMFDGSQYRLQVRGLDTGTANGLTFGDPGTIGDQLGFLVSGNTKQAAQNAELTVDGFAVTSATNQVSGAMQGVTLALKEETASGTVTVEGDANALGDKLQKVVDAYNAVIEKLHSATGHGKANASNPALSGDSALRSVANRLSASLLTSLGTGRFQSLGAIGVNLTNSGTLTLNRTKLGDALEKDRASVTAVLSGSGSGGIGAMDLIRDLTTDFTAPNGVIQTRRDGLEARGRSLDKHIAAEEARIERYADQLRKTFTAMDQQVGQYNAQLASLSIRG